MGKILIVGPIFYHYNESVKKSFEKLGFETKLIEFYDGYFESLKNKILLYLLPKIKINKFLNHYKVKLNEKILYLYNEFNPDLVLFIKGNNIFSDTLEILKQNSTLMLWMMDSIYNVPETRENINYFDYKFMFEKNDVKKLENEGIYSSFLPLGVDLEVYHPIHYLNKEIDVLFVGSLYEKRLKILEKLINDFPTFNIKIFGKYTHLRSPKKYYKYFFKKYYKYFINKNISPEKVNKLYSKSKIILNIHHEQSQLGCNPRAFEILASKSFQLVDNNLFLDNNFNRDEIIFFDNYNNLKEKLNKYITNPHLREEISRNGYKKVIKYHTFDNRVKKMLSHLDN